MAHSKIEALRFIATAVCILEKAEEEGDLYSVDPPMVAVETDRLEAAREALREAKEVLAA